MAPEGRQLEKPLSPDGFTPFPIRLLGMAQGYGSNPSGPPSLAASLNSGRDVLVTAAPKATPASVTRGRSARTGTGALSRPTGPSSLMP